MRGRKVGQAATLIVLSTTVLAGQSPSLSQVVARAGEYVRAFEAQLSSIVAEETYEQEYTYPVGSVSSGPLEVQRRMLRSDLLLLRPQVWTFGRFARVSDDVVPPGNHP